MTDLDAIRARRARANAIAHVLGRTPCDDDADALLAEVDRLTNLHGDKSCPGCLAADAEVDRLTAFYSSLVAEAFDNGAAAERARIRAAVEGLYEEAGRDMGVEPDEFVCLSLKSVLAVIEGGE